jgi:trehalose 6-phosphate phosphatase
MEFISAAAEERYAALVRASAGTVMAFDFDGTLSPIVDDPTQARIHPDAPAALVSLAEHVRSVAVITGRPARQAVSLGDLETVADGIDGHGGELQVFGQYGNERWSSADRRVISPRPPRGLGSFLLALPSVLRRADAFEAYVEEKGLAVAVHTRRLPDPEAAYARLLDPLSRLAAASGLAVEPGRSVIEVRAPGTHKGHAISTVAREQQARGFFFAGDDLGDLEAFAAVAALREAGMPTLLVCSSSAEEEALLELCDIAVDGPPGVIDLLRRFTADTRQG